MKLLDASARLLTKKAHVFLAALLLSLPFLIVFYIYNTQIISSLKQMKADELESIAELKIDQLESWRQERTLDASVISRSALIVASVKEYIRTGSPALAADLKQRVDWLFTNKEYVTVFFTNTAGVSILGTPETSSCLDPILTGMIKNVLTSREITHSNFYFCREHNSIHYDILAPLTDQNGAVIAMMVIRVAPDRYLYPYIQLWPGSSRSSETLIIKREADSVVFLNELRHKKNTALSLRISITRKDVVAVMSALGKTGFAEAVDYREVPVLIYTAPVPGSDWFLVAKIDRDEVFRDIYFFSWVAAGFAVFVLLAVLFGLFWLYHLNQRNIYRKNCEVEQTHRTVLQSIGDAVITTDKQGNISFMNPVAEKLTGWSYAEALKKPFDSIFSLIDEETQQQRVTPVAEVLNSEKPVMLEGNILLLTKSNSLIPVADSCSPVFDENNKITGTVLVFRDQRSARLRTRLMNAHLELLEFAADHSHHEVVVKALDELELLTGSTIGFLHFIEPDQETISLQTWSTRTSQGGCHTGDGKQHQDISRAGIWAECIYTKEPVLHNNYEATLHKKGCPEGHPALIRDMVVPLIRNEVVVAIIGLGNKQEDYNQTDIEITSYFSEFIWEISEKKRIQSEKEEHDRKFSALFSSTNDGIALYELLFDEKGVPYDYKIIDVNRAYESQTGLTAAEVRNKTSRQVYNTSEPLYFDIYKDTAINGVAHVFEKYFQEVDKYYLISCFQTGENQFATSYQDLTGLKKADMAFRESVRAFNTMIDNLSGVVYRCKNDHDWTMEYISEGIEKLSGYAKSDFTLNAVRTYNSLIHPDDQQMVWKVIQSAIAMQTPYVVEYRIISALNETKWVWERGRGVFEGNRLMALEGFISDITQTKLAEDEIRHINRLYAMLSQTNKAVVKQLDPESLFAEICRIAIEAGKFSFAWVGQLDETGNKLIPIHYRGVGAEIILERIGLAKEEEFGCIPCVQAVLENRIIVQNNLHSLHEESFIAAHPAMSQLRSVASAPIQIDGISRCVLAVFSSEVNFFRQKELNLLEEIGFDITFAIANYKQELHRKEAVRLIQESERKFSDLYEYSPDMFLSVDLKTVRIIQCNQTICTLTGYTKEELIGRPVAELYHPRSQKSFKKNVEIFKRDGKIVNSEMEVIRKDGSIMNVLLNSSAVYDVSGNIISSRSVWRDITAQKKLEAEEQRLWNILKSSLNEIYIFNRSDFRFRFVNEGALKNLGYSAEEMARMTPYDLNPEINTEELEGVMKPLFMKEKEQVVFVHRHKRKDGSIYDVEIYLQLFPYENDEIFVAMVMDITEKKKVEERLSVSDRIFQYSLDLLCVAGFDGYYKILNPAFEKTLGWTVEELLAKPWDDFVHPEDRQANLHVKSILVGGNEIFQYENRIICKDGSIKWLAWNAYPYTKEGIIFGVAHDITKRKLLEESIKESEERYRKLIEVSQDAIYINFNNEIVYANPAMVKLVCAEGNEQILGKSPFEFFHPDFHDTIKNRISHALATGEYGQAATRRLLCLDGSQIDIEATATPFSYKAGTAILVVLRDITERLRYENALQQKIKELEIFNRLSVGRELQMIELKQKINELSGKLGIDPVYKLDFLKGDPIGETNASANRSSADENE